LEALWAPGWNGTTFPAQDGRDPLLGGCTMTFAAVIVVLSVVPRTRTGWPVLTVLAEANLVPFS
jgi:hypothetical protein